MLLFEWSLVVLLFPSLPVPLLVLCWLHQAHQSQMVSSSHLLCTNLFFSFQAISIYLSLFSLSFNFTVVWRDDKVHYSAGLLIFTPWETFTSALADYYYYYYYYYYYLFTLWAFVPSVLADGFPLEFKWQRVSSSLQDLNQCPGQSTSCCCFDSFHSSSNFLVLQSF